MLIVDSQVHLWGANTPQRPWPDRGEAHRPVPISEESLSRDMAEAGVDRALLVPPLWEGDRHDLVLAAARLHPDRFAVMGRFDPDAPESRGQLATWRAQAGMLGVRLSFTRPHSKRLLAEGSMDWVWAAAEKAGVPFFVLIKTESLKLMDEVATRHPGLKLALDQLVIPPGAQDEAAFRHLDQVLALSKHPNLAVRITSMPSYSTHAYPYRNLYPYLQRVCDVYGPRRMFWGSDLSRLPGTYRQCVTMFTEEMPWLSPDNLAWIMGRGVCEWLGWKM